MDAKTIHNVRLSLDIDLHSHGEDENFTAEEINEAGGLEKMIEAYVESLGDRIAEIHDIEKSEIFANPSEYVEVTITEFDQTN